MGCMKEGIKVLPQGTSNYAQQINFGHSHLPRKNHPKMPVQDPQNEFPWMDLLLGLLYCSIGNLEFPGNFSGLSLEMALGSPNRVFRGE